MSRLSTKSLITAKSNGNMQIFPTSICHLAIKAMTVCLRYDDDDDDDEGSGGARVAMVVVVHSGPESIQSVLKVQTDDVTVFIYFVRMKISLINHLNNPPIF